MVFFLKIFIASSIGPLPMGGWPISARGRHGCVTCFGHWTMTGTDSPTSEQSFKSHFVGFPGGAVVENLPANAGDTGSSPGLGRSHMPRSNWAREPQLLSLRVWSLCCATRGRNSEGPAHRDEEWPPLAATRESPRTETKAQHSHKNK